MFDEFKLFSGLSQNNDRTLFVAGIRNKFKLFKDIKLVNVFLNMLAVSVPTSRSDKNFFLRPASIAKLKKRRKRDKKRLQKAFSFKEKRRKTLLVNYKVLKFRHSIVFNLRNKQKKYFYFVLNNFVFKNSKQAFINRPRFVWKQKLIALLLKGKQRYFKIKKIYYNVGYYLRTFFMSICFSKIKKYWCQFKKNFIHVQISKFNRLVMQKAFSVLAQHGNKFRGRIWNWSGNQKFLPRFRLFKNIFLRTNAYSSKLTLLQWIWGGPAQVYLEYWASLVINKICINIYKFTLQSDTYKFFLLKYFRQGIIKAFNKNYYFSFLTKFPHVMVALQQNFILQSPTFFFYISKLYKNFPLAFSRKYFNNARVLSAPFKQKKSLFVLNSFNYLINNFLSFDAEITKSKELFHQGGGVLRKIYRIIRPKRKSFWWRKKFFHKRNRYYEIVRYYQQYKFLYKAPRIIIKRDFFLLKILLQRFFKHYLYLSNSLFTFTASKRKQFRISYQHINGLYFIFRRCYKINWNLLNRHGLSVLNNIFLYRNNKVPVFVLKKKRPFMPFLFLKKTKKKWWIQQFGFLRIKALKRRQKNITFNNLKKEQNFLGRNHNYLNK